MHIPARAGAAETREVKACRGETLRDIARIVDADKKEWNAARAGPLQRRQPVTDLFEARAEAASEQANVVARLLRRLVEGGIGHQQGGGEIIGKRHTAKSLCLVAFET